MIGDFFRKRLGQMIDLRHPPTVLAKHMTCQAIKYQDLFGPVAGVLGCGISTFGRPRDSWCAAVPHKHAFDESDEGSTQRWGKAPTWQYISCNEYSLRPHPARTLSQSAGRGRTAGAHHEVTVTHEHITRQRPGLFVTPVAGCKFSCLVDEISCNQWVQPTKNPRYRRALV